MSGTARKVGGIERTDAEEQRFHESHECGCRSEANDDANSSQHEGGTNEHPRSTPFCAPSARRIPISRVRCETAYEMTP